MGCFFDVYEKQSTARQPINDEFSKDASHPTANPNLTHQKLTEDRIGIDIQQCVSVLGDLDHLGLQSTKHHSALVRNQVILELHR